MFPQLTQLSHILGDLVKAHPWSVFWAIWVFQRRTLWTVLGSGLVGWARGWIRNGCFTTSEPEKVWKMVNF